MGYESREACEGEYPVELWCRVEDCERERFWTDETEMSTCPDCGHRSVTATPHE